MLPFSKDTMLMIAVVAVMALALYLYKDLQKTKVELSEVKKRPQVVFTPPAQPARKAKRSEPVEIEEIKPDDTVADEQ
jgi:hypothetical protein